MPMMANFSGGPLDMVALALVVTALAGALERRPMIALGMLTLQGVLLTVAALLIALDEGGAHGYLAVAITLGVKVVAIPRVLRSAAHEVAATGPAQRLAVAQRPAQALALVVVLTAFYVVGPLAPAGLNRGTQALPASVAVMLLGLLAMLVQGSALAQVMALVTMENGLYLAALTATHGFPLAVELAVGVDALVAVVVMGLVSRQIHRTFGPIDTDRLRSQRG